MRRFGLGDAIMLPSGTVIPAEVVAANKSTEMFPGYCSWMPFADYLSACKVPTISQLQAMNQSNVGPALSAQSQAQLQGDIQQADASDCSANPEACGQFTFAGENPVTAATFGAGAAGQAIGGLEAAGSTLSGAASSLASLFSSQWAWLGLGAVIIIFWARGRR